jgi:hypothetical protein
MFFNFCLLTGQHLKKTSLSESSSDMMDLEDGVESTPGMLTTEQTRLAPFLGVQNIVTSDKQTNYHFYHNYHNLPPTLLPQQQQVQQQQQQQQQPQQPNCKQSNNGQNLQQRHNSALAVSIETDV